MKITLTPAQKDELTRRALKAQNDAEKPFIEARNRYNKLLGMGYIFELVALAELSAGLPDEAPEASLTINYLSSTEKYFAYTRSQRKNEYGNLAIHAMRVTRSGSVYTPDCTCPGFRNHGHCWASEEAVAQFKDLTRKNGTNGVWLIKNGTNGVWLMGNDIGLERKMI